MTPPKTTAKPRFSRRALLIAGAICAFVIIVIVGQLSMNGNAASTPEVAPTTPSDAAASPGPSSARTPAPTGEAGPARSTDSPLARRDPADPMAIGDVDAAVVLIEWLDLRCPFCASFGRDTLPVIIDEYVDPGLVRIEVHDVAYFGAQSEDAQVAVRAAAIQEMFFEYLAVVHAEAPEKGHPDLPREKLIAFAEKAGIPDMEQFTADLDDPSTRTAAQESTSFSQQIGVNVVPFFLAGDVALSGAQPVDVFRQYLDQAVEQAG